MDELCAEGGTHFRQTAKCALKVETAVDRDKGVGWLGDRQIASARGKGVTERRAVCSRQGLVQ
jgi:hypothetical protein